MGKSQIKLQISKLRKSSSHMVTAANDYDDDDDDHDGSDDDDKTNLAANLPMTSRCRRILARNAQTRDVGILRVRTTC